MALNVTNANEFKGILGEHFEKLGVARSWGRKVYLEFNEEDHSWRFRDLNLIQRAIRWCGGFKGTHLKTVVAELSKETAPAPGTINDQFKIELRVDILAQTVYKIRIKHVAPNVQDKPVPAPAAAPAPAPAPAAPVAPVVAAVPAAPAVAPAPAPAAPVVAPVESAADRVARETLLRLVKNYKIGTEIHTEAFKADFLVVMKWLGYEDWAIEDEQGQPQSQDFAEVFGRICEKLDLRDVKCEPKQKKDIAAALQQKDVVAFAGRIGGHWSTHLKDPRDNRFHQCQEYLDLGDDGFEGSEVAVRTIQELSDEAGPPPGYRPEPWEAGRADGYVVTSPRANPQPSYSGKIPNMNTCYFEAAIAVLAKIL